MKIKLLFITFFVSLISFNTKAQGAPPGCNSMAVVDMDEDGFATFDLNFYRQLILIWAAEQNYDLSGYRMDFYRNLDSRTEEDLITTVLYTNEVINSQQCGLELVYLGSGPQYSQTQLRSRFGCYILEVAPATGDWDNDGVPNAAEDLNNNQILADDDTDGDGTPNYYDNDDDGDGITTINEDYDRNGNPADDDTDNSGVADYLESHVALNVESNAVSSFEIHPNPASKVIYLENVNQYAKDSKLLVFDAVGKLVFEQQLTEMVNIESLKPGLYLLKFYTNESTIVKKLIVK